MGLKFQVVVPSGPHLRFCYFILLKTALSGSTANFALPMSVNPYVDTLQPTYTNPPKINKLATGSLLSREMSDKIFNSFDAFHPEHASRSSLSHFFHCSLFGWDRHTRCAY